MKVESFRSLKAEDFIIGMSELLDPALMHRPPARTNKKGLTPNSVNDGRYTHAFRNNILLTSVFSLQLAGLHS